MTATPHNSSTREGAQTQEQQQAPVVHDTMGQLEVDPAVQNYVAPAVGGQVALTVVLTENEHRSMRDFERWTHLTFSVGRSRTLMSF